jgi:hypothetical protein
MREGRVMTDHDLDRKAEQALIVVALSTATLVMCFGLLALG